MACDPTRLAEAKAAYHQLLTGTKARVIVDQNGERVEFTTPNIAVLSAYIARLEADCAPCTGLGRASGPLGFYF